MRVAVSRRGRERPGSPARAARPPGWARLLVGALALLFAPDCTGEAPDVETAEDATADTTEGAAGAGSEPEGVVLGAAVWTFAWDMEGVTLAEDGSLETETDLGYHVHVTTGRILSHSVSFGLCDPTGVTASGSSSGEGSFFGLHIRSAHAHAEDADPSMIETSLVEDLGAPRETEVASSFAAARYCRVHWLLARPLSATKGPDDVPMEGRSLFQRGTVARDGWRRPLAVDTWWPGALLVDLADVVPAAAHEAAREGGEPRHAFVTITRHLGRLFDGIDFETASEDQITGAVIENLVGGADIDVELWAPGDPG